MKRLFSTLLAGAAALTASFAAAEPSSAPHEANSFLTRLEALALIETLNAELLTARSATSTLEKWCADHHMAEAPKIVAKRFVGADKPASAETRQRLSVGDGETVKYRRVALVCGAHVLSEADNWYVPGRLTQEMNRQLEETETPFGKVVATLHPFRQTFEAKLLWSPLPSGWEMGARAEEQAGAAVPPHALMEHRALLYGEDQRPFSEVDETYTSGVLEFERAGAR
jgi:chorismate-pyruvate lyase